MCQIMPDLDWHKYFPLGKNIKVATSETSKKFKLGCRHLYFGQF